MVTHANPHAGLRPQPLQASSVISRTVRVGCMIGAVSWAMAGCGGSSTPPLGSDLKHNLGEPVRSPRASQYANMTAEQYAEVIAPLVGVNPADIVQASHPLSERLQGWIDKMDQEIRTAHPDQMANVPKPIVRLVRNSVANAFVSPAPVCYDVPVKISQTQQVSNVSLGIRTRSVEQVYVDAADGSMMEFPQEFPCLEVEQDEDEAAEILASLDGKLGDCHYDLSSSGELQSNGRCPLDESLKGVTKAKRLVLMKTANFVTVFSGIVPLMTEEAMVAAVGHEMGHYYRSHSTVADSEYGYFYQLREKQEPRKPAPDMSLEAFGKKAVEGSVVLSSGESYTRLAGQKLRSELYFAAGSMVANLCEGRSCPAECAQASDYLKSALFEDGVGFFPFTDKEKVDQSVYSEFERRALACFSKVSVTAGAELMAGPAVGWSEVRDLVKDPTWPLWLAKLPKSTQSAVVKANTLNWTRLSPLQPQKGSLAEAFVSASQRLDADDEEYLAVLKKAQKEGLGHYTIEQESDELAAEWVANTGLDPAAVVEAMRALGEGSSTGLGGFILGQEDCERLWKNKWSDGSTQYQFVPVGDYSEIHHSTCYRMFNLEREIKSHNYVVDSSRAQPLPVSQWQSMQRTAAAMQPAKSDVFFVLAKSPLASQLRFDRFNSCSYAPGFN